MSDAAGQEGNVEKTTGELIETLGQDVERCYEPLQKLLKAAFASDAGELDPDYAFHSRQFIRCVLAYIEAVSFSVKLKSVEHCLRKGIEVTDFERFIALEASADLKDNGKVGQRPAKIPLAANIRFAFRMYERACGSPIGFDPSSRWWRCLRATITVRDRLMHPRMPEDIDISPEDISNALAAWNGFDGLLLEGPPYTADPG